MKKVEVVAGIVSYKGEILCVQRPKNALAYISEKYEFPGGKMEKGESMEEALHRELYEELQLRTKIQSLYLTVVHTYPDFELTMHAFLCEASSKDVVLMEHIDQQWLPLDALETLDWAAADIPIVEKLVEYGWVV